ncbi:MAG: exosome complex protein Rrp42 [Nitrososphaerota archaeon]|nr:exosome complex protein Rrp42 [Candidatus Bathyarchaeota archaeon]MDW8062228.1 exosome complex protein Rrp42 [Nitrososphaerota archaeon]
MSSRLIVPELTKRRVRELASQRRRIDKRGLTEFRPVTIERSVIPQADGSALVHIGHTKAIAGVKIDLGQPYPDMPNAGVLAVNVELMPLASPTFEPGPPDERAVEVARIVDRTIREGKMLDLEELVIMPGREVYLIFVDAYLVDHDGNMIDACVLASIAALLDATMREAIVSEGKAKLIDEREPLPIRHYPLTATICRISDTLIVDPTLEEEETAEARITIGFDEEDRICMMQHSIGTLRYGELYQAINISREAVSRLREDLRKVFPDAR